MGWGPHFRSLTSRTLAPCWNHVGDFYISLMPPPPPETNRIRIRSLGSVLASSTPVPHPAQSDRLKHQSDHPTTPSRTFQWFLTVLRTKIMSLSRPEAPPSPVLHRSGPLIRSQGCGPATHHHELTRSATDTFTVPPDWPWLLCFTLIKNTGAHITYFRCSLGAEAANYPITEIMYLE